MTRAAKRLGRCAVGFSLLEMLISLVLLSLIAILIASAIQGIGRTRRTAEQHLIAASMGSVQFALRQLLAQTRPVVANGDPNQPVAMFVGDANRVRLVSSFASGSQFAGLYDTQIEVVRSSTERDQFDLVMRQVLWRGDPATTQARSNVVLVKNIEGVAFRYLGRTTPSAQLRWHQAWGNNEQIPDLIALDVKLPSNDARTWPQMIVATKTATPVLGE